MAINKKSFVAYCDWLESFEELSNEEAGKLVKHLFRYVNDLEPENPDRLTKMCFIPIKQSLKRDLKKYDKYIEKQSQNGKLGGRPKKATLKKETQKTQPFISKPKKADSVSASVSVSDSVIASASVSDINKKKEIDLVYPFNSKSFKNIIGIWLQYKKDQFKFKYQSSYSLQAMLKQLGKNYSNEQDAIDAIEYSMANGYKGIIKPQNTSQNGNNDKKQYGNLKKEILDRFI